MMTHVERALRVLEEARRHGEIRIDPHDAVEAIVQAGLLAPELPAPNDPNAIIPDGRGWLPAGDTGPSVWTAPGLLITVQRIEPGEYTPDEARGIAYALLAAAHTQENQCPR